MSTIHGLYPPVYIANPFIVFKWDTFEASLFAILMLFNHGRMMHPVYRKDLQLKSLRNL